MIDQRERHVRELLPLVRSIARRVKRMVPLADFDDLIGDGCVGLLRAVDGFDAQRGTSLAHYARRVIVGSMLNGLRRMDPVSERARRILRDAEHDRFATAVACGELPTRAEHERTRPGLAEVRAAALRAQPLSLDSPLPCGYEQQADWSGDPAALVACLLEGEALLASVAALPPRQRQVVELHYFGERSLRTIGFTLGISPQRSSQIHLAALERLRATHRA